MSNISVSDVMINVLIFLNLKHSNNTAISDEI